jgi:hypothetical protein
VALGDADPIESGDDIELGEYLGFADRVERLAD